MIVAFEVEQDERPVERPEVGDAAEQPLDVGARLDGLDDEGVFVDP